MSIVRVPYSEIPLFYKVQWNLDYMTLVVKTLRNLQVYNPKNDDYRAVQW